MLAALEILNHRHMSVNSDYLIFLSSELNNALRAAIEY